MYAPPPLSDYHIAEQAVVIAQRRKYREFVGVFRNIDNALRSASPSDNQTTTIHRTDTSDVWGIARHAQPRRLKRVHSARSNAVFSRAQAIA